MNMEGIEGKRRGSWWPIGPASAAMIVGVVVTMTWPMLGWPYPLWVQTSAQFHQQFTWAGLIAGTSACWHAVMLHSKRRTSSQPRAPRPGLPAVGPHLEVLVSWFVGAYLVALLPLVVSTVLAGGVGSADPLAILSGVLAMVAAVALGHALGTVVPSMVMVPVVAAGFYALFMVGGAGETYAAMPTLNLEPGLGQRESVPLLMFRMALFTMITASALGLAGRLATGRTHCWRKIVVVAAYAMAPAALIALSVIRPPVVFTIEAQPSPACTERHHIRYCVNPANEPRLADLVRTVDPIIARFGTKPTNVDQVWDQALTLHPIDANLARSLEVAWLNPDGTIQTQLAETIAGVHACDDSDLPRDTKKSFRVATDVSNYLSTGSPSGTLAKMSVAEVRRWIVHNQEQLRTCSLTRDQLPDVQAR